MLGDILLALVTFALKGSSRSRAADSIPRARSPRRARPVATVRPEAMDALDARYARWATRLGLRRSATRHYRFEGDIGGRHVVFSTGLGGSAPSAPDLVVRAALPVEAPLLIVAPEDGADREGVVAALAELLADERLTGLRSVGVTSSLVRLTFDPGSEPESIEAAREALEERLREVAGPAAPARSPFR